jgi:hypothetical protein
VSHARRAAEYLVRIRTLSEAGDHQLRLQARKRGESTLGVSSADKPFGRGAERDIWDDPRGVIERLLASLRAPGGAATEKLEQSGSDSARERP